MADSMEQFLDIIDNRIEKHLNFNTSSYIKQRLAKVIEVDTDSQKVYVYFVDDENQTQYVYYNKTNEIITSGDNVKVFYTSDIIKGWIGARCGEPNIKEIVQYGGEGVGRPSEWDKTSEYFNSYDGDYKNIAGTEGKENYYATAKGYGTKAIGKYSSAEGWRCSANNNSSHAEGGLCVANGMFSHAEGWECEASGGYSHVEGNLCVASGSQSHAEGGSCVASNDYSHAEGNNSQANSFCSHAEGQNCIVNGVCSHAEGQNCQITADYCHVEGANCTASYSYSHVEGSGCSATSYFAHAEGSQCKAGYYSHAEGYSCKAEQYSHAEGYNSEATGQYSHVEGANNKAYGQWSHVGGTNCLSSGMYSFMHGFGLKAGTNNKAAIFGEYNAGEDAGNYLLIIGNGVNDTKRSNALVLDKDGNLYCNSINSLDGSGSIFNPYSTDEAIAAATSVFNSIME